MCVGKKIFSIISWNVNGIRAVSQKGFPEWFARTSPDILCLQETRATREQFPEAVSGVSGFTLRACEAQKKGYSGVASWLKEKPLDTFPLGIKKFDDEGRTLIHDVGFSYVLNCYFPNGQRDHSRVPFKLEYCHALAKKVRALRKTKPVIVVGDYNTAHHPIDLANPKSNLKTTGFLPEERAWLDEFLALGMVDIFRERNPDTAGAYTWWSQRAGCRERNVGWRIDYIMIDEVLRARVQDALIHAQVPGSDHCPVELRLAL